MLKIIDSVKVRDSVIEMKDMKPLQVGIIVDVPSGDYHNHYVMRTASREKFEVMNLTNAGVGHCWTLLGQDVIFKVRLLGIGEKITIELSND
jgi:hypothetical protein